ncbi:hypothetical protein STEG23_008403 [Scotinomys teguina]
MRTMMLWALLRSEWSVLLLRAMVTSEPKPLLRDTSGSMALLELNFSIVTAGYILEQLKLTDASHLEWFYVRKIFLSGTGYVGLSCLCMGAKDINSDPGCCTAIDPDMGLSCSSVPDVTMALGGSPGTQIGLRLNLRPQTSKASAPPLNFDPSPTCAFENKSTSFSPLDFLLLQ